MYYSFPFIPRELSLYYSKSHAVLFHVLALFPINIWTFLTFKFGLCSCIPDSTFLFLGFVCVYACVCVPTCVRVYVLSLAGIHHDCIPAAELARWPTGLQSHQQDTGFGQSLCGQAVASRHFHRQRQICLVPRRDRGEQADPSAAQRSHSIQQPVLKERDVIVPKSQSPTIRPSLQKCPFILNCVPFWMCKGGQTAVLWYK